MANQHYTIIDNPVMEIDGKCYMASDWNLNLKEFLLQNVGKQIYILESSITTNKTDTTSVIQSAATNKPLSIDVTLAASKGQ